MANLSAEHIEEDISIHIFSVSAGLVGVCLTVIGILRVVFVVKNLSTFADDLLSFDALLFLTSCFLAYLALRKRSMQRSQKTERAADVVFIMALAVMAFACIAITYALL